MVGMDVIRWPELFAQTTLFYTHHYYLKLGGGRMIEFNPFTVLAFVALVTGALVAVTVGVLLYRNRRGK